MFDMADRENKAFAKHLKKAIGWSRLTIAEKYYRAERISKERHYGLPECAFCRKFKDNI
jgi:hypothetical protein